MTESDPILDLDALLDPARLAAAWQVARARPPAAVADVTGVAPGTDDAAPGIDATAAEITEVAATDAGATEVDAIAVTEIAAPAVAEPARTAPLPVARAHRQLLEEIERTLAASPGLAAKARRVLSVPLAQLAAAIDPTGGSVPRPAGPAVGVPSPRLLLPVVEPLDLAAAEAAIDQLEDVLQALMSEAGWPESPESE